MRPFTHGDTSSAHCSASRAAVVTRGGSDGGDAADGATRLWVRQQVARVAAEHSRASHQGPLMKRMRHGGRGPDVVGAGLYGASIVNLISLGASFFGSHMPTNSMTEQKY